MQRDRWLAFGTPSSAERALFLDQVLAAAEIDYARLSYDTDVLNLGLAARAQGRKIYIAATRYPDHATAIASHLGFDGVVTLADLTAGAETTNEPIPRRLSMPGVSTTSVMDGAGKCLARGMQQPMSSVAQIIFRSGLHS